MTKYLLMTIMFVCVGVAIAQNVKPTTYTREQLEFAFKAGYEAGKKAKIDACNFRSE